jgi:hypothetical protein
MAWGPRRQRSRLKSPWTGTSSRTSRPAVRSRKAFGRIQTGRVVVVRDIEPAQGRRQFEGGEMIGRQPCNHRQSRQYGVKALSG